MLNVDRCIVDLPGFSVRSKLNGRIHEIGKLLIAVMAQEFLVILLIWPNTISGWLPTSQQLPARGPSMM